MEKLKPCPFCGGEADYVKNKRTVTVGCLSCTCQITGSVIKKNAEWLIPRMLNQWNTRHGQKV